MSDTLARAFQKRARLTRTQLLIEADLRPVLVPDHVDIAVPGYAGRHYAAGSLCLVSVNPAGGKDAYQPSAGDQRIYAAAKAFAEAPSPTDDLQSRLAEALEASMPSWGAQWSHVRAILAAAGADLSRIAYVYVLPFRTRDDAGSKLPARVVEASYAAGFAQLMSGLAPGRVITMDRISEACINRWMRESGLRPDQLYYTRKRDAHTERRALLAGLEAGERR